MYRKIESRKQYDLTEIRTKYAIIWKILKKCEETDNPKERYKSKCVTTLQEMVKELTTTTSSFSERWNKDLILAITYLYLGILYSKMDDTTAAMKEFTKCIYMLEGRELKPEVILPAIYCLNELGKLHMERCKFETAEMLLEKAERFYIIFTENVLIEPINMSTIVGVEDTQKELSGINFLEKLHIITLEYLTRLYDKLEYEDKSVEYCHKKLNKQLRLNNEMNNLDYIVWICDVAAIAMHYKDDENFPQARYHLAVASYMLQKYRNMLDTQEFGESQIVEYKHYYETSAEIAKYWVKYGLTLMEASHEPPIQSQSDSKIGGTISMVQLTFEDIDPAELETITSQVTDEYLQSPEAYKTMYQNILKWSDQAKAYYTSKDQTLDFVYIESDLIEACRHLTIYKVDDVYVEKMFKERINVLQCLSKKLNPQNDRIICQKIWLELAEAYTDILNIITNRYSSKQKPSNHVKTINRLAKNNIKYYRSYLGSVEIGESMETGNFRIMDICNTLYASFRIGELFSLMTFSEVEMKIKILQNRLEAYQFIVSYCNKHPDKKSVFDKEMKCIVEKSKKQINTLPLKLFRLRHQLKNQ